MFIVLFVALGGAVGSIARFVITAWIQPRSHSGFPWGTYAVNSTGSLAIGIAFALFEGGTDSSDALNFIVSGILGGYTTFSTFSVENLKLLEERRFGSLLHNTVGQVSGGLLLAALGYWFGSMIT